LRPVQTHFLQETSDLHKRPAIFLWRWRIHDNASLAIQLNAKIAAKTGITGCGPELDVRYSAYIA
jgi:hypothetical protein